jgi:purine-binding chemotaxis protein CheW
MLRKADRLVIGSTSEDRTALIVRVGTRVCAIPVPHVGETMRPLPIETVAGMPSFLSGVAVIRGEPVPVIDLQALLEGATNRTPPRRFVTLKLGDRRAALAVHEVLGLGHLDSAEFGDLPMILRDVAPTFVEAIGTRDAQLLIVLQASRILPEEVWTCLAAREVVP